MQVLFSSSTYNTQALDIWSWSNRDACGFAHIYRIHKPNRWSSRNKILSQAVSSKLDCHNISQFSKSCKTQTPSLSILIHFTNFYSSEQPCEGRSLNKCIEKSQVLCGIQTPYLLTGNREERVFNIVQDYFSMYFLSSPYYLRNNEIRATYFQNFPSTPGSITSLVFLSQAPFLLRIDTHTTECKIND